MLAPHVPKTAPNDGVVDAAKAALGDALVEAREHVGEITLTVAARERSSMSAARCATRPASNISS